MSKFTVNLNGRPEDLLRQIGMSLNSLIRRLVGENGTKPIRTVYLKPEQAEVGWLREHVVREVAFALSMKPNEMRTWQTLEVKVREVYLKEINEWIEEHRERLAELGFIRDDEVEGVKFDRFGRPIR